MIPAIFGVAGTRLSGEERAFFADADPAGYILFKRNCENRAQLRALTDELRAIHGREKLLIAVDQEGGRVARMTAPEWPSYPAGAEFDRLYDVAPASAIEAARANAEALAIDLSLAGITCTHAPVLDVRHPCTHEAIGDRALGSEPQRVAALGRAVLDGLARAGVVGTIKHIPGHGLAASDSHLELPTVDADNDELASEIAPFCALNDAAIAMTAHIVYTAWDRYNPATQSPYVIEQIIRRRIGFAGLLLTDDLDMQALAGTVPERASRAIDAGCDIALNCWAKMDDMIGIAKALPGMNAATAARLEGALAQTRLDGGQGDQLALAAKRDALLAQRA